MAEMRRGLNEKEDEAEEQRRAEETEAIKNLQDQLRQQQEQNRLETDKYLRQIDELRETLTANDRGSARLEERIKREREDLMTKLQDSEARNEELRGSMTASTRPLLRQIGINRLSSYQTNKSENGKIMEFGETWVGLPTHR